MAELGPFAYPAARPAAYLAAHPAAAADAQSGAIAPPIAASATSISPTSPPHIEVRP